MAKKKITVGTEVPYEELVKQKIAAEVLKMYKPSPAWTTAPQQYIGEIVWHTGPVVTAPKPKKGKPHWDGWVMLTREDEETKVGDVVCLPQVDPGLFNKYCGYMPFYKGLAHGWFLSEHYIGQYLIDIPTVTNKGKKANVWRKKRGMNPIYSKPLPLP